MDNEPYRDLTHREACDYLYVKLFEKGGVVKKELRLPNGKIADIAWRDQFDDFFIFEIKTYYKASYAAQAWDKYHSCCDYLFLVVPGLSTQRWGLDRLDMCFAPLADRCGVMSLDRDHDMVLHPPRLSRLRGERALAMHRLLSTPADR